MSLMELISNGGSQAGQHDLPAARIGRENRLTKKVILSEPHFGDRQLGQKVAWLSHQDAGVIVCPFLDFRYFPARGPSRVREHHHKMHYIDSVGDSKFRLCARQEFP